MSSTNELSIKPVVDIFDNEGMELPTKSAHEIDIRLGDDLIAIPVEESRLEKREGNDVLVKSNGEVIQMVNPNALISIKKHIEDKKGQNKKVNNINSEKTR